MITRPIRTRRAALALAFAFPVCLAGCASSPDSKQPQSREIDDLLTLVRERLELAAEYAHETGSAAGAQDALKSEEIVDSAVNRAREYTLPPEVVREFFSAQIEAALHVQSVVRSQGEGGAKSKPRATSGESVGVKPRVEPASVPLIAALSKAYPVLRGPGGKDLLIRRAETVLAGIPGGLKTTVIALRPLLTVAN